MGIRRWILIIWVLRNDFQYSIGCLKIDLICYKELMSLMSWCKQKPVHVGTRRNFRFYVNSKLLCIYKNIFHSLSYLYVILKCCLLNASFTIFHWVSLKIKSWIRHTCVYQIQAYWCSFEHCDLAKAKNNFLVIWGKLKRIMQILACLLRKITRFVM